MAGAEVRPLFFYGYGGRVLGIARWNAGVGVGFFGNGKICGLGIFFVCGGEERKIFSERENRLLLYGFAV